MAAALSKAILFSTARHDRKVFTHPVAVFGNDKDAKAYATFMRLAHRSSDADALIALDPKVTVDGDGKPVADIKWSIVTVPYAPSPDFGDEDDTATDSASTE